ncbi:hypothetical protein NBRC110019_09220 [Neptunitalea chrysea]|uniref:Fibronectin type-III domain-containing protein n=1 Tax=Neptunitalea chrysea TaxID=1647581 RepID=A0A9W6B703_9FLAO|nr:T9SS type A sorting domain-containing protein [Neptunitalea chrysea]GLB51883.1 hypothetical protein NBRC110019_09220 [Neptunitalea chrysea]
MKKITTILLLLLCSLYGFSQGNDFSNPIVISSLPYTTNDNTANYGNTYVDSDSPCSTNYLSGDDVVYSFTPSIDGTFIFDLTNISDTYAGIIVLDGLIDDASTTCVSTLTNSNSTDDMSLHVPLTVGVTYYILISTWADPQSISYTLDVNELSCISAEATAAVVSPDCDDQLYYIDVDVTTLGNATGITDGTTTWPISGTGVTQIGPFATGTYATLNMVHSDALCDYELGTYSYFCPAMNDDCSDAIEITVNSDFNCGSTVSGTTVGATESAQDNSNAAGTANDDVWFYFTATNTEHRISLNNVTYVGGTYTSTDMVMAVYDGTTGCSSLTYFDDSDPDILDLTGLTVGNMYYVRVYSYYSDEQYNTFDICVGTPPVNNSCAGAESITIGTYGNCNSLLFDTNNASDSGVIGSCELYDYTENDLWFTFTTNATAGVTFEVISGTVSNLKAAIYDSCGGSEVYCQSNFTSGENVITVLQPNTTYLLQVWTDDYSAEAYEVCITDLPACPAPSYLGIDTITSTTAMLEWTENGSSLNWDIEWGTTGFTPTGTPNINDTADNPYLLEGLSASTDYDFYVRADCGMNDTDTSIWLGPYSFNTLAPPPSNDECDNPTALTVNADLECGVTTTGTTTAATTSAQDATDVSGTANDDVWFSFEATATNHLITLSNVTNVDGGWTTDMGMALYDATGGCNALTFLATSDPNQLYVGSLTIGDTYLVRVYSWYDGSNYIDFDICVGTPNNTTTQPNDDCDNAIALTVNADLNCGVTTAGSIEGATPSAQEDIITGIPNTDVWYSFVATTTSHKVSLSNVADVSGGATNINSSTSMGMAVYDTTGGCSALTLINDSDTDTLDVFGLTAGNTYYVRVYGWTTGIQYTTFDICVGTPPPPPANDECSGAISLTVENNISSLADATQISGTIISATDSGITAQAGTANDDVWYSFVATTNNITIDVTDDFDGVIEVFSGSCGSLTSIDYSDYSFSTYYPRIDRDDYVIGETYYIRVYYYYDDTPSSTDFTIAVWSPDALSNETFDNTGFTYYPNPVNGVLNLKANETIQNVAVYNLVGQQVLTITPEASTYEVNMSNLVTGTYFVNVTIGDKTKTVKIIKN